MARTKIDEQDREIYRTAYWIDQGFSVVTAMQMAEETHWDELIFLNGQLRQWDEKPLVLC